MNDMPLRCVAIDDEPLALELIRSYISRIPSLHLINTFEDAISAMEYLTNVPVDVLFIDISMPDISGIEMVKALKNKPMIIFTTAYKQFAFDGFELEAVDYLLKPFDFERFSKAAFKAIDRKKQKDIPPYSGKDLFIYVHSEYRMIKIELSDIEYLESREDYVQIHLTSEKPVSTLMSLKKMIDLLPQQYFKRIHRSYIVPVAKIKSIQNKKIQLNSITLPIGESYTNEVKKWLNHQ